MANLTAAADTESMTDNSTAILNFGPVSSMFSQQNNIQHSKFATYNENSFTIREINLINSCNKQLFLQNEFPKEYHLPIIGSRSWSSLILAKPS